jgi:hypothetical protein
MMIVCRGGRDADIALGVWVMDYNKQAIEQFFEAIKPWQDAYVANAFSYIAFRQDEKFCLAQGLLSLNVGVLPSISIFASNHIRAGRYLLADLGLSARAFIQALLRGEIDTPSGKLHFLPNKHTNNHSVNFSEFHPSGEQSQNRANVLYLKGECQATLVRQPLFDWELKAESPPYDNVQELMNEYGLGLLRTDSAIVEVVGLNVAAIDFESLVQSTKARPAMRLATGLSPQKGGLTYRVFSRGQVVMRSKILGSAMRWTQKDNHQLGEAELEVPQGAVLHCVATYAGVAQQFSWISDATLVQNSRRTVYETFDPKLETLRDIVTRTQGRGLEARDLESAVAWLLWMLGFSVAHLGGTRRTQEAVDLVAVAPNGHVAVIECTTGLLRAENKLSLLHDRTQAVRKTLDKSDSRHLKVLPVIVTSKSREEVRPELEQAEKNGIFVMTGEGLQEAINQTLVFPNANVLLEQAHQTVRMAQAKYDTHSSPVLPSSELRYP